MLFRCIPCHFRGAPSSGSAASSCCTFRGRCGLQHNPARTPRRSVLWPAALLGVFQSALGPVGLFTTEHMTTCSHLYTSSHGLDAQRGNGECVDGSFQVSLYMSIDTQNHTTIPNQNYIHALFGGITSVVLTAFTNTLHGYGAAAWLSGIAVISCSALVVGYHPTMGVVTKATNARCVESGGKVDVEMASAGESKEMGPSM